MLLSCCSLVDDNTKLQLHDDILSLVVNLPSNNMLYSLGKRIVDRLISSPVGSKDGIHATIDKPYGRNPKMNVYQPHVLRQYWGNMWILNHVKMAISIGILIEQTQAQIHWALIQQTL